MMNLRRSIGPPMGPRALSLMAARVHGCGLGCGQCWGPAASSQARAYFQWTVVAAAGTPAVAALAFLWPALGWLRRRRSDRAGAGGAEVHSG